MEAGSVPWSLPGSQFRLKIQEANLQPPELSQTPRQHEVPAAWSRVGDEGGLWTSPPSSFPSSGFSAGLGSSASSPKDLLCWEVRWPGPWRVRWGRASWRLGNWEGSEDLEKGFLPDSKRKSCAKVTLEKLREVLLTWPQSSQ